MEIYILHKRSFKYSDAREESLKRDIVGRDHKPIKQWSHMEIRYKGWDAPVNKESWVAVGLDSTVHYHYTVIHLS